METDILKLVASRSGHFRLESGHHSARWLDLERLCLDVRRVEALAADLADRLEPHRVDLVCGPLVEGAFVALMVAARLDKPFVYAERIAGAGHDALFPVRYRLPDSVRGEVRGRRVAIVNDFTSAGSAVRGTWADVLAAGGLVAAVGSLVVLGEAAPAFCRQENVPLETLCRLPFELWEPASCPLCATGQPLEDPLPDESHVASSAAALESAESRIVRGGG